MRKWEQNLYPHGPSSPPHTLETLMYFANLGINQKSGWKGSTSLEIHVSYFNCFFRKIKIIIFLM